MTAGWGKAIGSTVGATLAGTPGSLIGGVAGDLVERMWGTAPDIGMNVVSGLVSDQVKTLVNAGYQRLQPSVRTQINHDLQAAFRDALREAIYDIGGRTCFKDQWAKTRRDTPTEIVFNLAVLQGDQAPLMEQVCECLHKLAAQVDTLLSLQAPVDQPNAVYPYLQADDPDSLSRLFWEQVIQPFWENDAQYRSLRREFPDFEAHLRRHLFARTLVHLGENLKQQTAAWRAFNRLMLETLRDYAREAAQNSATLLEKLNKLQLQIDQLQEMVDNQSPDLILAEMISRIGAAQQQVGERFDDLTARIVREQRATRTIITGVEARLTQEIRKESQSIKDILVSSDVLGTLVATPLIGTAPYKGLAFFDQADEALYFGRRQLAGDLANKFASITFGAIVGASGSGKSSLIRAGVLPLLVRQEWHIAVITPTDQPLAMLAKAYQPTHGERQAALLADLRANTTTLRGVMQQRAQRASGKHALLVVDQFEELFTQSKDESVNCAFVANLLNAAQADTGLTIIILLRADFYAHCAHYEGLAGAVATQQHFLEAMTDKDLYDVILEPARRNGWRIQEGLAEQMIADVGNEPGALPFLSYALLQTWERRRHNVLTLAGYQDAGGVKGAIAKAADLAWASFDEMQQTAAKHIFLSLTELGETQGEQVRTPDTRRRMVRATLSNSTIAATVLDNTLEELRRRRLLTLDQEHIEVAHEALIRAWPRLRSWLDAERDDLRTGREVLDDAQIWLNAGRNDSYLYSGVRLEQVQTWLVRQSSPPVAVIEEFIQSSAAEERRQREAKEATRQREIEQAHKLAEEQRRRAEEQQRRVKNSRLALIWLSALALLALALTIYAFDRQGVAERNANTAATRAAEAQQERDRADQEADKAKLARETADANAVLAATRAAEAELAANIAQSRALAVAAKQEYEKQPMLAWLLALEAGHHAGSVEAFSEIYRQAPGITRPKLILTHAAPVAGAKWSKNGKRILTWSVGIDVAVHIWDAETGVELHELNHGGHVQDAQWIMDDNRILTLGIDGFIRIWDSKTGELLTYLAHDASLNGAQWYKNGNHIISWSTDKTARFWNAKTGERLLTLTHGANVNGALLSEDERHILTWSSDNTACVWDSMTGDRLLTLTHDDSVSGALWNNDESRIVTWSEDQTSRVWDANTGNRLFTFTHQERIYVTQWNKDESRILTLSGGILRIWDARVGDLLLTFTRDNGISDAQWVDETRILIWNNHEAVVWDTEQGIRYSTRNKSISGAKWNSYDVITWGNEGIAEVHSSWGLEVNSRRFIHDNSINGVEMFGMLGFGKQYLLTWSTDRTARVWDTNALDLISTSLDYFHDLRYSKDKIRYLTSITNTVSIRDSSRISQPIVLAHDGNISGALWNLDDTQILTWGEDKLAKVWNSRTGDLRISLGHDAAVLGAQWNSDESRILTWSNNMAVKVWDTFTGMPIFTYISEDPIRSALWNPDGNRILVSDAGIYYPPISTCSNSSKQIPVKVLDSVTGNLLFELAHDGPILGMQWNESGSRILTWGADKTAKIWMSNSGDLLFNFDHNEIVYNAQWSKDGSRLLTMGCNGSTKVWDATTGKLSITLYHGIIGQQAWAKWNNRGDRVVIGQNVFAGDKEPIRVWNTITGKLLLILPLSSYHNIDWSEDGRRVLLQIIMTKFSYYTEMEDLLNASCTQTTRNLTWAEWQQFLPDEPYRQTCPNLPPANDVPPEHLSSVGIATPTP